MQELDRLKCIEAVVEGDLQPIRAAERLGLTPRQVRRLAVAEKLAARHHIVLCKETVRRVQIAAGLWIPRKLRPPKIQQPRARRACTGGLRIVPRCGRRWCTSMMRRAG
jgi:hypothetical protein